VRSSTGTSPESLRIFDVDATMETMVPEPYVHCVSIMTGGSGGQGVRRFYSEHFINQIPRDAKVTLISRTVGKDQVVDEFILSFTHDTQWDYLLPGIPPTGKRVELPHVLVMKFENGRVAHEHVWWDQASLLVQVGLLDPENLRWWASSKQECCYASPRNKVLQLDSDRSTVTASVKARVAAMAKAN
jgi:carboxymethylenebutenolidase